MSRVSLRHSSDLTQPRTWYLLADGFTARCCIQEAESSKHVVELALRGRRPRSGALHVRALDHETWLLESAVVHRDLARMELLFVSTPDDVSRKLMEL